MSKTLLVAFSQYKLGGVQNFYYNLLSHAPGGKYTIKWIFEKVNDKDPKLQGPYGIGEEIVFDVESDSPETTYEMARRLGKLIPKEKGIILANFWHDLVTLHLYRRPLATVFFVCHDEGYVPMAADFEFLIDVFIAHNYQFYEEMVKALPHRKEDVYFIPYGVRVPDFYRIHNPSQPLNIVIAARLQVSKGINDLPVVDELIKKQGVLVNWTIIGQGPEKQQLEDRLLPRGNFRFFSPARNEEVLALMQQQDVFILPSRLDGLPVAMLEAMSVGCVPVISRFNKGIEKVVTSDIGFVLPVEDLQQFADSIIKLDRDRDDLRVRSRRARAAVVEHYNIGKQSRKYFDLFENFGQLKKPVRKKFRRYGGWLDHPLCPVFLRSFVRIVKAKISI